MVALNMKCCATIALVAAMFAMVAGQSQIWVNGIDSGFDSSGYLDDSILISAADQLGTFPDFPYLSCGASNAGAYTVAPTVISAGGGKYCFTILVDRSCPDKCCAADLNKIEIDSYESCIVSPVPDLRSTVNNVSTPTNPAFARPQYGGPGSAMLRLTQLNLTQISSSELTLCITLRTNRLGQGCPTLLEACRPPPGAPRGTCFLSFVSAVRDCCPSSYTPRGSPPLPPSPPPPSPSPPPPSPSPPPACPACVTATFMPPLIDVRPFRLNASSCAVIQSAISSDLNDLAGNFSARLVSPFQPAGCTGLSVTVCGNFFSKEDADLIPPTYVQDNLVPFWLETVAGGSICRPELEGYSLEISTGAVPGVAGSTGVGCLQGIGSTLCAPQLQPFPNCTCNYAKGVTPYSVAPSYTAVPVPSRNATIYCFTIESSPVLVTDANCKGADKITKVEFYADEGLSAYVRNISLIPKTGKASSVTPAWGASGTNTLKATPMNWSAAQAVGGKVCLEVRNAISIDDLCLGDGVLAGQCFVSVFSSLRCCPIYRAGP